MFNVTPLGKTGVLAPTACDPVAGRVWLTVSVVNALEVPFPLALALAPFVLLVLLSATVALRLVVEVDAAAGEGGGIGGALLVTGTTGLVEVVGTKEKVGGDGVLVRTGAGGAVVVECNGEGGGLGAVVCHNVDVVEAGRTVTVTVMVGGGMEEGADEGILLRAVTVTVDVTGAGTVALTVVCGTDTDDAEEKRESVTEEAELKLYTEKDDQRKVSPDRRWRRLSIPGGPPLRSQGWRSAQSPRRGARRPQLGLEATQNGVRAAVDPRADSKPQHTLSRSACHDRRDERTEVLHGFQGAREQQQRA